MLLNIKQLTKKKIYRLIYIINEYLFSSSPNVTYKYIRHVRSIAPELCPNIILYRISSRKNYLIDLSKVHIHVIGRFQTRDIIV